MMIVDASVIVSWLAGEAGRESRALEALLSKEEACLAPVTITELLSHTREAPGLDEVISHFGRLELTEGYWERAGFLRAKLRKAGRKAGLGDALVAQACIDHDLPLLARDRDFRAFAEVGGLKLA